MIPTPSLWIAGWKGGGLTCTKSALNPDCLPFKIISEGKHPVNLNGKASTLSHLLVSGSQSPSSLSSNYLPHCQHLLARSSELHQKANNLLKTEICETSSLKVAYPQAHHYFNSSPSLLLPHRLAHQTYHTSLLRKTTPPCFQSSFLSNPATTFSSNRSPHHVYSSSYQTNPALLSVSKEADFDLKYSTVLAPLRDRAHVREYEDPGEAFDFIMDFTEAEDGEMLALDVKGVVATDGWIFREAARDHRVHSAIRGYVANGGTFIIGGLMMGLEVDWVRLEGYFRKDWGVPWKQGGVSDGVMDKNWAFEGRKLEGIKQRAYMLVVMLKDVPRNDMILYSKDD